MKIFLTFFLVTIVTFAHTSTVHAEAISEDAMREFTKQLTAVERYLDRTYNKNYVALSEEELRDVVVSGTDWIVTSQEANGHFRYEYLPFTDEYENDDNIVRQAGTLSALADALKHQSENDEWKHAAMRSAEYFESLTKEDTYNEISFGCIVNSVSSLECKLGSTALALVGLLRYVETYPEERGAYEDTIETYKNYLIASNIPEKGFRNKHRIEADAQKDDESSFSNGETLLALVRYYQYNPSEEVKTLIDETFSYFKNDVEFDTPLYLWAMAALKDMQKLWPHEEYQTYAKEYTHWRVTDVSRFRGTQRNYCAYIEGVVSAYSILENTQNEHEMRAYAGEIDFWLSKLASLQITDNDEYRIISHDGTLSLQHASDMNLARGGFLTAHNEPRQRIDFTQHCVSSYVQTLADVRKQSL